MRAAPLPLDPRTERLLAQELKPGESVLWQSGALIRRHLLLTLPIFLFALPWTAFALFWMAMASRGSVIFALFGLPFVGVGLAMLSAPWWAARKVRRIGYVLTTDRVLILTPNPFGGVEVRNFLPQELGALERVQRDDGSGDLIFCREWARGAKGRRYERKIGFIGIPEVGEVQARVEELGKAHRSPRA